VQQSLTAFPSPEELSQRYAAATGPITRDPYAAWSAWVDKRRFDDIADLARKKAWFFADRAKDEELPLEDRLNDKATARALRTLALAAKKRDAEATLEGLKRWARLIDHQAHYEAWHS
jgi:hypothetical protein